MSRKLTIVDHRTGTMGQRCSPSIIDERGLGYRGCIRPVSGLLLALLALLVLYEPLIAQSDSVSPIEIEAQAGFDGYYKGEFWTPVQIDVSNVGPDTQGHLQVVMGSGDSSDQVIYRSPISLPTLSSKRQALYVQVPPFATALVVELVDDSGEVLASAQTNSLSRLAADTLLYGVVTDEPGRLPYLEDVTGGRSEAAVAYLNPDQLPEVTSAWNALDVIVVHGADSGQLTAAQRRALEGWLETGGRLVITGGPSWQETSAGVLDLLPVTISGTQTVDDIPALRQLSGLPFRDPGPYLVTSSGLRSGELLLDHEGAPLLARSEQGKGSVYFLALDPALAPLLDWDGSKAVWSEIVKHDQLPPDWAFGVRNSYAAASAVSSLPTVALPAAWALFLFLLIYVVVVGPLNYFFLRRLGRRELAWLTIPGLVILFSLTAYVVGFRLKGNETIINQMSVAYGTAGGDQVRVQTLIGLYSPRRATYDLTMPPEAIPRPFEQNFGALGGQGNIGAVERAGEVIVTDIRVDVGGVETLVADSYQPGPQVDGIVRLLAEAGDFVIDVAVQNNGSTTLENATMLVGSTVIPLGDLAPGSRVDLAERITAAPGAPGGTVVSGGFVPRPPAGSPLTSNLETILGSSDYYNDRDVYPRWQLLQALAPEYGLNNIAVQMDLATLIAWSDEPQLALGLRDEEFESSATSLYFLEMPLTQEVAGGRETVLPRPLLNWRVLAHSGVYDARASDFYLPPGWIEFEFQPWTDFQSMTINNLAIILQAPDGASGQRVPQLRLWNWSEETWRTPGDPDWGRIEIEDPLDYVGPDNAIRIQVNNVGPEGIQVQEIYPELTGSVQ